MKQIRPSVFETNSSSTHSLSIVSRALKPSELFSDDPDYKFSSECLAVQFGEYGWGPEKLITQQDRLSYLCTMFWELECRNIVTIDDIFHRPGYAIICDAVEKHTGKKLAFRGIEVVDRGFAIDGYIDHQSYENYHDLADFLNANELTAEEFIFGNVTVNIDNDNH